MRTVISRSGASEALFRSDPNQTRAAINCNLTLSAVAQQRAEDMAARHHYFSHVNPDGVGPTNWCATRLPALPSFYSMERDGNNIESIAGGFASAQEAWTVARVHRPPAPPAGRSGLLP
ncbi:MAG: hypothetical protein H6644_07395 [Caldilineaceae bacterium]|nr:hypothetical protein [Caldilineaceae bacterium]